LSVVQQSYSVRQNEAECHHNDRTVGPNSPRTLSRWITSSEDPCWKRIRSWTVSRSTVNH